MKQLILIVMSLLAIMACAQEEYHERINMDRTRAELAISPEGLMALGTDRAIYANASTAGDMGSVPGWRTKILQALQHAPPKKSHPGIMWCRLHP